MIKKEFSNNFDGLVWKMIANPELDTLVLEIRKQVKQTVDFLKLDMNTFALKSLENLGNNWWLGLQESRNQMAIFQIFDNNQMPASKAILGYDLNKNSVIWQKEKLSFHHANDKYVATLVQENEHSELKNLDILTGKEIQITEEFNNNINTEIYYPLHYKNDNQYFADIAEFIQQKQNHIAVEAIDYLEVGQLILISYYICDSDNKLSNYLFIINEEGELVLSETLGTSLPGIGIDTFWIWKNKLVFIKNKSELNIHTIF